MKWGQWIALLLVVLLTAACGSEEVKEQTSSEENGQIRTIDGPNGEVEIEGVPKRVVVLEWSYVEHILPLGIQPVGVADKEGYNKWVNAGESLADDVVDVGTRSEPNFEAISRLNPDLIIGADYRHEEFEDQLKEIAPTIMFAPYSEEGAAINMST
ncbi:iron complex transport system substrate-binding protein [Halobacillus karajensis]|uniref:ABC transporter substrate-binding protein n=1 Tax=Halobacillus karajensis TaxID=195088 RepID=UPI0008A76C7F|nr:ABC transporter substrate-binding protein [Halobacillus karajensis]SEH79786.1 iron complex transport system substrate-binding protein [Halobacillus karajensis]